MQKAVSTLQLPSKASQRAYIIAQHLTPYVCKLLFTTTDDKLDDCCVEDERSALNKFVRDEEWAKLCDTCEEYDEEESILSKFKPAPTTSNHRITVDQLTAENITYIIAKTIEALDQCVIDPKLIRSLNLNNAQLHDGHYLHMFLPKCNQLTSVNLSNLNSCVNNDTMEYLGRYLPQLREVVVDHCPSVTDDGCNRMFSAMQSKRVNSLNKLNLSHTGITEQSLNNLMLMLHPQNKNLSVLECDGIEVHPQLAERILHSCLKLLKLMCGDDENYSKFRDNIVLRLPNTHHRQQSTRQLDLSNSQVTNEILNNILNVYASPYIQKISLRNAQNIDDSVVDIIAKYLKRMPNLVYVDLEGTQVSDALQGKHMR